MNDEGIRVYVNEQGVTVPQGSLAIHAVRALFPELALEVEQGRSRLTDSRGLPVNADVVLSGGSIFRVLPVRDRAVENA